MEKERWRPVTEYPETYEVSNLGRVRRLTSVTRTKAGYILTHTISRDGYLTVGLSSGGKAASRRVHRLVWEAFKGPIPKGHVVNHKDGNKTNPNLKNLEAITNSQNILHAYRVLGRSRPGEKLTAEDARAIRERRSSGEPLSSIAQHYNVSEACISSVHTGKTWKHAGGPITPSRPLRQTRNEVLERIAGNTVLEAVRRYHNGESSRALADEYGVSDVTILNWAKGKYRTQ